MTLVKILYKSFSLYNLSLKAISLEKDHFAVVGLLVSTSYKSED